MEITDNAINANTEVISRSSRSRSKTPAVQQLESEKLIENKKRGGSVDSRKRGDSTGPVTSTPNEIVVTSTSLSAISESYSETVVKTKSRKSSRQKATVTNGKKKMVVTNAKKKIVEEFSSDEEQNETVQAYKNAGEWWNVFPKTDFTYSSASSFHNKELSPGIHQMPNMSRPSLSTYTGRPSTLFRKATVPTIEKASTASTKSRWDTVDSDFENEDVVRKQVRQETKISLSTRIRTWMTLVWTTMVQSCSWTNSTTSSAFSTPKKSSRTQERPTPGEIFLVYVYMGIARLVLWNTLILCLLEHVRPSTHSSRNRALVLLCLLPLLLFGGLYLADADASNTFSPLYPLLNETRSLALTAHKHASLLAGATYHALASVVLALWERTPALVVSTHSRSAIPVLDAQVEAMPYTIDGLHDERLATLTAEINQLRWELTQTTRLLAESETDRRIDDLGAQVISLQAQVGLLQKEKSSSHVEIEQYISVYLSTVFGQSEGGAVSTDQLKAWIQEMVTTRQEYEARSQHFSALMDKMKHSDRTLDEDLLKRIVDEKLALYDADKLGVVDYALESGGASILSTRCTEHYEHVRNLVLFGFTIWSHNSNPRTVIQPGILPGQCWAFKGVQGYLVIQLIGSVQIKAFTMEHVPQSLVSTGNIDSAPKDFTVLGLESLNDPEPVVLGSFTYLRNGSSLQQFYVQGASSGKPYRMVELRIESNHGNMQYTCLYRFRVHGTWISA